METITRSREDPSRRSSTKVTQFFFFELGYTHEILFQCGSGKRDFFSSLNLTVLIFIDNRTFLERFGSMSGEFGRCVSAKYPWRD